MKVSRSHITLQEKEFNFYPGVVEMNLTELKDQASISINIYCMGENYFTHGDIKGSLNLKCDICLSDYLHDVSTKFKVYVKLENSDELMEKNELDTIIIQKNDDFIDFTDYIRELFVLEIPIQKKCQQNCKGLCPVCGNNLNKLKCSHGESQVDPRWAGLNELREKLN